ncbi:MAG TPA: EAL domain-containing protein [Solirubrobacter sp.]|nr:EAL domain-containing protein [Solirubrobacter sp.]
MADSVLLARQPILDARGGLIGYELLFRPMPTGVPPDPVAATATVIVNALADVGLDAVVGSRTVWVNVTREFLLSGAALPLPPDRVVLELVEDQRVDRQLLSALRGLADSGFAIALDDFEYTSRAQMPLLDVAQIVKLDVRALDPVALAWHARGLKARGMTLVAEKVETHEEHARCRALGFDAFQGYFFAKPALVTGRRVPSSHLTTLCALIEAGDDVDISVLHAIISRDLGLSQRMLRLANAAAITPAHRVGSLRHALARLGTNAVRRNAKLLSLAQLHDGPDVVINTALVRAKMASELAAVAGARGGACPERAFTVGLFSLIDALLNRPFRELACELPFDGRTMGALLEHSGPEGSLLDAIVAHERGGVPVGVDPAVLARSYRSATAWADALQPQLA